MEIKIIDPQPLRVKADVYDRLQIPVLVRKQYGLQHKQACDLFLTGDGLYFRFANNEQ